MYVHMGFFFQIVAIASAALEEYRTESKKMVIALVDMERSFIPPQHFIRLVQRRHDDHPSITVLLLFISSPKLWLKSSSCLVCHFGKSILGIFRLAARSLVLIDICPGAQSLLSSLFLAGYT